MSLGTDKEPNLKAQRSQITIAVADNADRTDNV